MEKAAQKGAEPRFKLPRVINRVLHQVERLVKLWGDLDVKEGDGQKAAENEGNIRSLVVLLDVDFLCECIPADRPDDEELTEN